VTEESVRDARSIERFIGANVERKKLEGFDYTYSALFDVETLEAIATATAKPPAACTVARGGDRAPWRAANCKRQNARFQK